MPDPIRDELSAFPVCQTRATRPVLAARPAFAHKVLAKAPEPTELASHYLSHEVGEIGGTSIGEGLRPRAPLAVSPG